MIAEKEQKVYSNYNFPFANENYATIHIGFLNLLEDSNHED